MNRIKFKTVCFLSAVLLGSLIQPVSAKMYKWIDETGKIIYSDTVPPNQVKYRRESLSKQVRVIEITEKEKTKLQHELANRLIILRKKQEVLIDKQKSKDKLLLSAYRNVDDMNTALKMKILALDSRRQTIQNNVARLEAQLQNKRKKAAQYDRDGKKLPKKLKDEMNDFQQQITQKYEEISNKLIYKEREINKFTADIQRYKSLNQSGVESQLASLKSAEQFASNELGLYRCESIEQCQRAWVIARKFVVDYSSTQINTDTDNLIMSNSPFEDTDLSLSVSKMKEDKVQQLFLDIRCHHSFTGQDLCKSQKVIELRRSFYDYIASAL